MAISANLIDAAFLRLAERSGFAERPSQKQLAQTLGDLIEQGKSGVFEAPTGLGKSLAALIPAIANAIANDRRTVIATYTNVLAEQYWQKDLPFALELFRELGEADVKTAMLMGRQRYVCNIALAEQLPSVANYFLAEAKIGNESEFRRLSGLPARQVSAKWSSIATPPVCPGRFCELYDKCLYYRARRKATKGEIVITNHSVVIQDSLLRIWQDGEGLLGDYDFLILDEVHDFPQAAQGGLEFELSAGKMASLSSIAKRVEASMLPFAERFGDSVRITQAVELFQIQMAECQAALRDLNLMLTDEGILEIAPQDLFQHPEVSRRRTRNIESVKFLTERLKEACAEFLKTVESATKSWEGDVSKQVEETITNYRAYIREFGVGVSGLFEPKGVAVTYSGRSGQDPMLRQDIVDLSTPLQELIWNHGSYACMSGTLTVDGNFDFFKSVTGATPEFEEVFPSPFDYGMSAGLYMPAANKIPDPAEARKNGSEQAYFRAVAAELSQIIESVGGRTLALFHSRREMEAVAGYLSVPEHLPVYVQAPTGAANVGERFLANKESSLLGLRSFWTGFDAPGETLSCVVLVRIPFEVPIDPPQIARLAYLQSKGQNAFMDHTLPLAKMMMRQGAGRLLRRTDDKGLVAVIDPRVRSKRYGEDILNNLPPGMRVFDDITDAVGHVGLAD